MRVDIPKTIKQGNIIRVLIEDYTNSPHEIHFCSVGWPGDRVCIKSESVKLGGGMQIALVPIAVDETPGMAIVSMFSLNSAYAVPITVEKSDFAEAKDTIFVSDLKGSLKARFNGEKNELKRILAMVTPERFWKKDLKFSAPLHNMAVTSPFGEIRHKASIKSGRWDINHFGVDLLANTGTEVFAAEAGIVRVAENWLAEGNLVIIDHGYGLVSLYFHLSKLKVKKGDRIKAGDLIAKSGQSGAAKGPHLHFEVRLFGVAVSPWNFMPESPPYQPNVTTNTLNQPKKKRSKK